VLLIEIGGTVGDIEAMPFLEAIRQLRLELPEHDTCLVHVTLIPYLESVGQLKSKPTQHSVRTLQGMGLQPDIIVGRARESLSEEIKHKISLYCSVPEKAVISNPDLSPIYDLPLYFEQQNMGNYLCSLLQLSYDCKPATEGWTEMVNLFKNAKRTINIAMPGKYTSIIDSYVSINYALQDAGAHLDAKVNINWIDTEAIEENPEKISVLDSCDGCLLTPGFGSRGVEGMIQTANYAIQNNIPYLGICFGAQLLTVAFARNVMGWKEAHTTEVDAETQLPVIDLLPEQKIIQEKGGTMKLGAHKIIIQEGTKLWDAYRQSVIQERFRHRYHIIEEYTGKMKEKGFITSAYDETGKIVNAIEINTHPFCVGVQFHPEYTSRPNRPNPLYFAFIKHALERSTFRMNANE
jgi:CTP synthase